MTDKPFSERMGLVAPKPVQIDDLDKDARTALYNVYLEFLEIYQTSGFWYTIGMKFLKMERSDVFYYVSGDGYDYRVSQVTWRQVKDIFFQKSWYACFDLMEKTHQYVKVAAEHRPDIWCKYTDMINDALKRENIGYKFIEGNFVPIQTKEEQSAVEDALKIPYTAARGHVEKAVALFSKRPAPDYANSIKESISAAESVCKELTGEKDFAAAARKMKIPMHPAFRESMVKLYGFASDEEGVRHAATGEPLQVNQATARYVLITCAAFVSYIAAQTSD